MYTKESAKMAQFRSIDDLNGAIRTHIYRNKSNLSPSAIDVLKVLSRHAVKTPGVAWLKIDSIASLIGKHRTTIIRAIKRLETLGIIRKEIKYRPVSGGNGANMYVILAPAPSSATAQMQLRQDATKPTETKADRPKSEDEAVILKSKNNLLSNTYAAFRNVIDCFVTDRRLTSRLYGVYLAQTSALKSAYDKSLLDEIGLNALRIAFIGVKRKHIRNIVGYYSGILTNLFDNLYRMEIERGA
ncbi:helix-turn-helix domain-containing protein [Bacillus sp. FSL K6-2971]|uniref:helix-turn-helix domain-containing protein n=1 Tax=Bacillus sp. FSL K6-2971 TaxID=2921487 RepID=UPI0030FCE395